MNYIKELNAFRNFLLTNQLSVGAISLWHTLMSLANATGWKKRFNAPSQTLCQLSGLSRQGVLDARNSLVAHGLIRCESGQNGRAPVFEMISLVKEPEDGQTRNTRQATVDTSLDRLPDRPLDRSLDTSQDRLPDRPLDRSLDTSQDRLPDQPLDTLLDQSPDNILTIPKQKQYEKEEDEAHAELIAIYEQNIGSLPPLLCKELLTWEKRLGKEIVIEAIRIAMKHSGRTFRYLETILTEWEQAGIKTVAAVFSYEKQKSEKGTSFQKQQRKTVTIFDALRKEAAGR
ncbi:DnaD domain protein [Virgibacillus sp. 179-BFC.A HS]|uniref:DnaD domain protein n=1 Tax=Tigheibacillus jepli TaxID=3035914 RepID=A0ABU5CED8_9BACI|nr:DnaD domain protein [Virgibacillus sp. 179-BFC.A HS]MDY0404217.1 DnaD domain protein [Virgibacillus sp. 179-BFC.A HS]